MSDFLLTVGTATAEGQALLAQGIKQGEVVRDLKASKADKVAIDTAVAELLAIKAKYKVVCGEDFPAPGKGNSKTNDKAKGEKTAPATEDKKKDAKKDVKKDAKKEAKAARQTEIAAKVEAQRAAATADDCAAENYGKTPLIQSTARTGKARRDVVYFVVSFSFASSSFFILFVMCAPFLFFSSVLHQAPTG